MNKFGYILTLLSALYGIDMESEDMEEIALVGWNLIGNKRMKIYRDCTSFTDCDSEYVYELPCNFSELEAITTDFEDWDYTNGILNNGNFASAVAEQYTEARKRFQLPLYVRGKFVPHERVGNTIYFDRPYRHLNIVYKGEVLDDDGLPEITDKEARALATYVAWIVKLREAFQTNNSLMFLFAELLHKQWTVQCDLARVGEYFSLNDWNEILDIKSSWHKHQRNKSTKLYQV